jgi:hypothetical protein
MLTIFPRFKLQASRSEYLSLKLQFPLSSSKFPFRGINSELKYLFKKSEYHFMNEVSDLECRLFQRCFFVGELQSEGGRKESLVHKNVA